jgi:predicted anti-sigma-YlaC factor YlaD
MADCTEAYRFICDNLDQNLNSPHCRRIRRHLTGCVECRTLLDSVKKTVLLYRLMPVPRVPSTLHKALVRTVTKLQTRPKGRHVSRSAHGKKGRGAGGSAP